MQFMRTRTEERHSGTGSRRAGYRPVATRRVDENRKLQWRFDAAAPIAAQRARRAFVEALRARSVAESSLEASALIFGELVGNAVRHAPRGALFVELDWGGAHPVLRVCDRGQGFSLTTSLPAADRETGRGLFLVSRIALGLDVSTKVGQGCTVSAVLPVNGDS